MAAACGSSRTSRRRTPWRAFRAPKRATSTAPNYPNIRDPAVDHLLEAAKSAGTWDDYVAAIRAFDRVMLWNFYLIPGHEQDEDRIAHWDRYDWVDAGKLAREVWTESWWWDEARAAGVAEYLGE